MIDIKIEGAKVAVKHINSIQDNLLTKSLFSKIGFKLREVIDDRTEQGLDVNNHAFAPYSSSYLKKKGERGGRFFDGTVNLNDKGNMLSAMSHRATDKYCILGFNKAKEALKAHGHNTGGGVNKKRKFFSASPSDKRKINALVRAHANKLIL